MILPKKNLGMSVASYAKISQFRSTSCKKDSIVYISSYKKPKSNDPPKT